VLGLDRTGFIEILRDVPQCVRGEVAQVNVTGGIPDVRLHSVPDPVRLDGDTPIRGPAAVVMHEAAIALAQAYSIKGPTLLLMDDFGDFIHPVFTRKLLTLLAGASRGFQTVVVTHQVLPPEVWREWTVTMIGAGGQGPLPETARPDRRPDGPTVAAGSA
jgi:hypothetical protein